jgi:hypothetical protein
MSDKLSKPGKDRTTIGLDPDIMQLLRDLALQEQRSMAGEVSHLVLERARTVGPHVPGRLGRERRN